MSFESYVSCSIEGSDVVPIMGVNPELQESSMRDSSLSATSSPAMRRSRRTPVVPSKLRDMEVSLFVLRNTKTAAPELKNKKLSKNRNRKSSCQISSQKDLSTLGIAKDEITVKIEYAEEDYALADFVVEAECDVPVDLSSEMLAFVYPCVTKVELVGTDAASVNSAEHETAGAIPLDGESAPFLSVNDDAVTCSPAANFNTESQLVPSSVVLQHPEAWMSKEEETPSAATFRGLECLKDTWFNHPAVPSVLSSKRNCYYCHKVHHTVARTMMQCKTCKHYLCLNKVRNCLVLYHYGTLEPSFVPSMSPHTPFNGAASKIPEEKSHRVLVKGLTLPRPGEDIFSFTPLSHPPIPVVGSLKKKCWFCYWLEKRERRSKIMCQICKRYYCLNKQRNCLLLHHDGRL